MGQWEFKAVTDLLDAFKLAADLQKDHEDRHPDHHPHLALNATTTVRLGDFERLWHHLGKQFNTPSPKLKSICFDVVGASESSESFSNSTNITSPDKELTFQDLNSKWGTAVSSKDKKACQVLKAAQSRQSIIRDFTGANTLSTQSPKRARSHNTNRFKANVVDTESETEILARPNPGHRDLWQTQPPFLYLAPLDPNPCVIRPIFTLTQEEQVEKLARKLSTLPNTEQLTICQQGGHVSHVGIHVFVDASNIVVSFYDNLKKARGLDVQRLCKRSPFNYHGLSMILERGRPIARRILLGSRAPGVKEDPEWVEGARSCKYEVNILERVLKDKPVAWSKRRRCHFAHSGLSSSSETPLQVKKAWAEQGVDELLHMKMLESLADYDTPSTIVLASGDAAVAEYSGGFFQNVLRLLRKGWKVEVVSWRDTIGKDYLNAEFCEQWKDSFKIIFLDNYLEELLAIYAIRPKLALAK